MPIINGEIYCPKCNEKIDKQLIKEILVSEAKIKNEATEISDKIKCIMDDIDTISKENKKFIKLYNALCGLELLIDQLGDAKLSRLVNVTSIIEKNLPNPLKLERKGEDIHYERNFFIKDGRSKRGEIQIKYDGDLLKAYIILNKIGENSFIINDERVIEVLHFIESINCKKE